MAHSDRFALQPNVRFQRYSDRFNLLGNCTLLASWAVATSSNWAGDIHSVMEDKRRLRNSLPCAPAAGPSPLKIVATQPPRDVKRFTDGIKTRDVPRFHRFG
jgi:hypothetical protein